MSNQVIIVAGGLSGFSAAHTVLERGWNVFVLDKNSFFGGNSTKATPSINGALIKTQIALGVQGSAEIFAQDTARSARDLAHPDHIRVLTGNSAFVVEWLQEKFKLNLSLPDRARLIKKARVTKLIKEGDAVIGVEYVKDGQTCKEYGPVILATGGYAADFTENPLLKKYCPGIYNLPTTKGEHSTGKATHMEKVQPDAKIKFLAAEALRDVGGLLLNGHRDYLTGDILKTKVPVRLVLNCKASKEIEWHFKHYATFDDYYDIASNKKKDPFGKKFFHNTPITINYQFHVALMSPDGIDINAESEVRGMQEQVIPGLFASGEIAGGVHGAIRLGGSSLLGCVVYGRVAGDTASRYLFQNLSSATANRRLGQIVEQLAPYQTTVSFDPTNQKVHLEISWVSHKDATSQYTPPVQAPQASSNQAPTPGKKADAPTHCWVIVNGEVLNVTNFLPGKSNILIYAGKDATEEFNMLHVKGVVQKYSPESIIRTIKR
ncbi:hypothetical protein C2G38_2054794 [Gigaspora rosea]|uniref:Cytochrome b5 heme-binding domain-containing protein n=1 Tax=Gigaspora rosea TaxID=44941 RepID=A0A397W5V3_9GLOM|nr:hypothetical protein C2G38_2054794 [Gigaspora rosea]